MERKGGDQKLSNLGKKKRVKNEESLKIERSNVVKSGKMQEKKKTLIEGGK